MRGEHTAVLGFHTNFLRLTEMSPIAVPADTSDRPVIAAGTAHPEEPEDGRREVGERARSPSVLRRPR